MSNKSTSKKSSQVLHSIEDFIQNLSAEFSKNANAEIAKGQKAYMKNHFEFFGIKTEIRRELQKPFLIKTYLPSKIEAFHIIKTLWQQPEREYQYFAQELASQYLKQTAEEDIALYEFMIVHKSWWDTVDFIATKLLGNYFKKFPNQRSSYVKKWLRSGNIWLQRSALLFQLQYKEKLDTELLTATIQPLLGSKEFFINKAIGWVLRHYSRTNPDWVVEFVNSTPLENLSRKEALRLIQ